MLPKGQHSWNIFVTKEARVDPKVVLGEWSVAERTTFMEYLFNQGGWVDPKVVLETLMECPFFARTKNC